MPASRQRAGSHPIASAADELPTALLRPCESPAPQSSHTTVHGVPVRLTESEVGTVNRQQGYSLVLQIATERTNLVLVEEIPHAAAAAHGDIISRRWAVLFAERRRALSARALLSSAALVPACAQQPVLVCTGRE